MNAPTPGGAAGSATRSIAQTMSRGIRIMEVLAEAHTSLSAQQLADSLGFERPVVYRLLRTLVAHKLVTSAKDGGYTLGVGLLALSRGVQQHLREIAFPHLVTLAEEANVTAYIGIREGDEVVCVATVEPRDSIVAVRFREGLRRPMSRGASAFAIRSSLPGRPDDPEEVVRARQLGYAVSSGAIEPGASAVSSPLELPGGPGQGCVTAIFPTRDTADFPGIAKHVVKAAEAISDAARRG